MCWSTVKEFVPEFCSSAGDEAGASVSRRVRERERDLKKNWKGKGVINEVKKAEVVAPNAVFRVAREFKKKKSANGILISNHHFLHVKSWLLKNYKKIIIKNNCSE